VTICIESSLSTRWSYDQQFTRYFDRVVRRQYCNNYYLLVLIVVLYSALTVKDITTQTSCCRGFWWPFRYCTPSCWLKFWNPPGTSTITRDVTREYIFYNMWLTSCVFSFLLLSGLMAKKNSLIAMHF